MYLMNNIQKRFILFSICILVRTLFVILAYYLDKKYVYYASFPSAIIGIGFLTIYFGNFRGTGAEVFGSKIWWNSLRPLHGFNYLVFAYLAFTMKNNSYIPLLFDVILGTIVFIMYHYKSNNFRLLLR